MAARELDNKISSSIITLELIEITDELSTARSALAEAEDQITALGAVAPTGVSIIPYSVVKTQKDGTTKEFDYYKAQADLPIFEGKGGATRYLHLGKKGSKKYKAWVAQIARRNAIASITAAALELSKLEGEESAAID
ncbi:hypothetical protein [Leptolyngbya ohadii]|uniref:hypothetical protein n=1 Tax=Leptolyngbya ohadii TaxID=1962290 RepID=UPI000B599D21|nr:hypothetical protein [Leptolyngbya ohadii]